MMRFLAPLLCLLAIVLLVAALANQSASADAPGADVNVRSDHVIICHPVRTSGKTSHDVLAYRVHRTERRTIEEHEEHGDVIIDPRTDLRTQCPGDVILERELPGGR